MESQVKGFLKRKGFTMAPRNADKQKFVPTGWNRDTDDGLHMEANKGADDGVTRITASVKGEHGEKGFWISKTPEAWAKFLEVVPDIEAGINDFYETRAMIREIEAGNAQRAEKLAALKGAEQFMSAEAFKGALAKLDHDFPHRTLEGVRKAKTHAAVVEGDNQTEEENS